MPFKLVEPPLVTHTGPALGGTRPVMVIFNGGIDSGIDYRGLVNGGIEKHGEGRLLSRRWIRDFVIEIRRAIAVDHVAAGWLICFLRLG